jgi:predicted  nucleic acid-binding Zn-ribbon protein
MTEEDIAELRSRIDQVEEEFGRRANILLDEVLITDENLRSLTRRFDQLAESQQATQATVNQLTVLMVQLVQNVEADRAAIRENQAEIRRILEYLQSQYPGNGNSRGGQ